MASIEGTLLGGRYRVGPIIGRGGMSVVHAGEDLLLSRPVALKLILGAQSRELGERLFREGRAAARTNHPALVTIFDFGTDEDTALDYLVMELLEGEDLRARLLQRRVIPVTQAIAIAIDVADALVDVHGAGIVHRDLKPANVFLARRGLRIDEVKLLDFGVAKQVDLETLTVTGQSVGTLAYMAPEQVASSRHVDPRSDLYALGVLLHECLTGTLPHPSRSLDDVVQRVWNDESPRLSVSAELPDALATIVERCLQPRAEQRYASARELRDALLRLGR